MKPKDKLKAQQLQKIKKQKISQPEVEPIDLLMGIIMLAYIVVPTFTPNWMALDTNAPKFFTTAMLNFVVFILLAGMGYLKDNKSFVRGFFTSNIGLLYSGFLVASLLSFSQSVNLTESALQFTKVFTVFAAVLNLSFILMRDLRYLRFVAIVMSLLLIFDSFSVFYNINKFINGEVAQIADIKTVYSNKNILASAIFVKLAFALWLLVFEKNFFKTLGWIALLTGFAATFFMATRAFFLGLSVLTFAFIGYNLVLYLNQKQKGTLALSAAYVSALLIALFAFTFTQKHLYPKEQKSRHTQGVVDQLASIQEFDTSTGLRIDAWRWSFELLKEKPLLGVGSGNWKVAILKHENQKNPGFIYLYKAHNDFIETFAETGIIGGLLYLGIFLAIVLNFFMFYRREEEDVNNLQPYFFLAAAGVGFYSVDAFFNFPVDRPEILALFVFFVAAGIATLQRHTAMTKSSDDNEGTIPNNLLLSFPVALIAAILLAGTTYVLYVNFQSSKNQRIVYQEIMAGQLREKSDKIIAGFPAIPNVSIWGEPIQTLKARYLIDEEKHEEAIEVLRHDFSSPWDARREFFMAMAFNSLKQSDSALHYSLIAAELKPNYFRNIHLAATLFEQKGEYDAAAELYDNYLANNKRDKQAYLLASNLHIQNKNLERAAEIIAEGRSHLRRDADLIQQETFLNHRLNIDPHLPIFNRANSEFNRQRYAEAVKLLDEFLEIVPAHQGALQLKAFSHYHSREYEKSLAASNQALSIDDSNSSLVNLRGVCFRALNRHDEACADFKKSMEMGNESGKTNFERFCAGK
jgi:putative inorganic carbon (hco3(-)) transporter